MGWTPPYEGNPWTTCERALSPQVGERAGRLARKERGDPPHAERYEHVGERAAPHVATRQPAVDRSAAGAKPVEPAVAPAQGARRAHGEHVRHVAGESHAGLPAQPITV